MVLSSYSASWIVLQILLCLTNHVSGAIIVDGIVITTHAEQRAKKNQVIKECVRQMMTAPPPSGEGLYCPRTYDTILCWNDTPAGTVVTQPCPDWVGKFKVGEEVTRECTENGTWFIHPVLNISAGWSNYSNCYSDHNVTSARLPLLLRGHIWRIRVLYTIGYSLSLCSLFIAVAIMAYFKRLHCPRNTVHVNLFLSFMLRALANLLKDSLMPAGALQSDMVTGPDNKTYFVEGSGTHWECKALITFFTYALSCNYTWILVEGLYLHMLIFVSVFSERSSIKPYICLGWGAPFLFVIPWVVVRGTLENVGCWGTHKNVGYFWIIRGPITATIVVNAFLFVNIVRVLFSKLSASNTKEARRYRYIKLAKSTLVLIPLFGVHWIVFLCVPDSDDGVELVKLYFEMIGNSLQGFIVALLFCFLNGDVRAEIRKKWERYQLTRDGSGTVSRTRSTFVSTYVSRARNSLYSIHSTADRLESFHLSSNTNTDTKNSANGGSGGGGGKNSSGYNGGGRSYSSNSEGGLKSSTSFGENSGRCRKSSSGGCWRNSSCGGCGGGKGEESSPGGNRNGDFGYSASVVNSPAAEESDNIGYHGNCNGRAKHKMALERGNLDNRGVGMVAKEEEVCPMMTSQII